MLVCVSCYMTRLFRTSMVKTCNGYIAGVLTLEGHYSSDIRVFLSNTKCLLIVWHKVSYRQVVTLNFICLIAWKCSSYEKKCVGNIYNKRQLCS